jgi:hypothetical protein
MGCASIAGIIGLATPILMRCCQLQLQTSTKSIVPLMTEIFAICKELDENVVLTADTAQRLSALN